MTLKNFLLTTAVGLAIATPAAAQVNTVPQVGVNTGNSRETTYSAVATELVPAALATDIACITPGTSKSVYVKFIQVSGVSTSGTWAPVTILRRNLAVDTGGTAATGVAALGGGGNYSNNNTLTSTVVSYTANPTINDTSPTYLRSTAAVFPPSIPATTGPVPAQFWFGTNVEAYDQEALLTKGTTQQLCVNLNGFTIPGGMLTISFEWAEF